MTKSTKRILLSSIAMLLVALVALGSATFAWFTINKTVTANNMKVQAVSADGLVITNLTSHSAASAWSSSVSFNDDGTTALQPVSVAVAANAAMPTAGYIAEDVKRSGGGHWASGDTDISAFKQVASILPAQGSGTRMFNNTTYVTRYDVLVATNGSAAMERDLNVTLTGTGSTGLGYAKAALVYDGNVIAYYSDDAYNAITGTDPTATGGTTAVAASTSASKTNVIGTASPEIPTISTGLQFTLYVWFEGNDDECVDANQTGSETNFTLTFTLAD